MATNFPNARNVFLPELPPSLRDVKDVNKYLEQLRTSLELHFSKQFDNAATVRDASDTLSTTMVATVGLVSSSVDALTITVSNLSTSLSTSYANVNLSNLSAVVVNTHMNFNGKQAITFVVENRTSDPTSPVAGQMWFRTDI